MTAKEYITNSGARSNFLIEQETVCAARVKREARTVWLAARLAGHKKTAAKFGHSRDSPAITSDLAKVAGCLLTPTVANAAAADSAPSGSAPNCQTSCTILFKGQVLKPASTKQNVLTDTAEFKLYLFGAEFQRGTQHVEETHKYSTHSGGSIMSSFIFYPTTFIWQAT